MLRIALCDDETTARDTLRCQIEPFLKEEEEIVYEFSSGQSAVRWLRSHAGQIDLLFLDIEMKESNGMETARLIRTFDQTLLIVFVTGYSGFRFPRSPIFTATDGRFLQSPKTVSFPFTESCRKYQRRSGARLSVFISATLLIRPLPIISVMTASQYSDSPCPSAAV